MAANFKKHSNVPVKVNPDPLPHPGIYIGVVFNSLQKVTDTFTRWRNILHEIVENAPPPEATEICLGKILKIVELNFSNRPVYKQLSNERIYSLLISSKTKIHRQ